MTAIPSLPFIETKAMYRCHPSHPVSFPRLNLFNKIDLGQWVNEPLMPQSPKDPALTGHFAMRIAQVLLPSGFRRVLCFPFLCSPNYEPHVMRPCLGGLLS